MQQDIETLIDGALYTRGEERQSKQEWGNGKNTTRAVKVWRGSVWGGLL